MTKKKKPPVVHPKKKRIRKKKVKVNKEVMSREDVLAAIELIEGCEEVRGRRWEERLDEALEKASVTIPSAIFGEDRRSRYAVYKIGIGEEEMIVKLIGMNAGEEMIGRAREVGLPVW